MLGAGSTKENDQFWSGWKMTPGTTWWQQQRQSWSPSVEPGELDCWRITRFRLPETRGPRSSAHGLSANRSSIRHTQVREITSKATTLFRIPWREFILELLGGDEVQTLVKFLTCRPLTQGAFSKLPCLSRGERVAEATAVAEDGWGVSCQRSRTPWRSEVARYHWLRITPVQRSNKHKLHTRQGRCTRRRLQGAQERQERPFSGFRQFIGPGSTPKRLTGVHLNGPLQRGSPPVMQKGGAQANAP